MDFNSYLLAVSHGEKNCYFQNRTLKKKITEIIAMFFQHFYGHFWPIEWQQKQNTMKKLN